MKNYCFNRHGVLLLVLLLSFTITKLQGQCNIDQYQDGADYQAGDEVQNMGKRYKCLVGGWCSIGGPYAPGGADEWAWVHAWEELGSCDGNGGNQLPVVSIDSPTNGTVFSTGDAVNIMVSATDNDGAVSKVEFLVDGTKVGEDTNTPFALTWTATEGNHALSAYAIDNNGEGSTSEIINITVQNGDTGGEGCDVQQYVNGSTYQTGDEVQNLGRRFTCLVGGWCSAGGAYTPGGPDDWAWPYAWEDLGECNGDGNVPTEITSLIPNVIYIPEPNTEVLLRVKAVNPSKPIDYIMLEINGWPNPASPVGNDIFERIWIPADFGTYTIRIVAFYGEEGHTEITQTVTVKQTITGGDFLISKAAYNDLFPYRFGTDPNTLELDPTKDFFTYEALAEALERMKNIEVTFERRSGTNLYRLTRRDKQTNQSVVIRTDQDFDADWNQSKPIITQVVDYGNFANEGSETIRKRELAAFLANIAQETTGGWDTAPGGRYSWGLHFREEVGFGTPGAPLGYRDEGSINYPPAPGKSYHGRGPIQLSWNYNYGQISEFLYGDKNTLLSQPELVVQDGALAFQTAIWFWMTPQFPKPSAHDVMVGNWTPSAYDLARNRLPGFGMTVNIINGGLECGSGTEIAKVIHRIGHYERFSGILGINVGLDNTTDCSECGCKNMTPYTSLEPEPTQAARLENKLESATAFAADGVFKMNTYPNPINENSTIQFYLEKEGHMSLKLYNHLGMTVKVLVEQKMKAGGHEFEFSTEGLLSGIYFYQLTSGGKTQTMKILKE